jgi:N-carbamoyl-L-amino-acid hydrolase
MVIGCGFIVSFSSSSKVELTRQLQNDIHETAKWSAPSPGGVTRLCADENDKMARDWFREQVLALGADYKVNATGTQFAKFEGEDNSIPPIAMGSHMDTVATGGKFDGPLGVSLASHPSFSQWC